MIYINLVDVKMVATPRFAMQVSQEKAIPLLKQRPKLIRCTNGGKVAIDTHLGGANAPGVPDFSQSSRSNRTTIG
jgi:hypothetical protein